MNKQLLLILITCSGMLGAYAQGSDYDNAAIGNGANQFSYFGNGWTHGAGSTDGYFNTTLSYSNQTGNYAIFTFTGYKVAFFSAKASHHGIIAVSIDNGPETNYDLYNATRQSFVNIYVSPALSYGNHTLKIRVTGTKNPSSSNTYAIIDYATVFTRINSNTVTGVNAFENNLTGEDNAVYGKYAMQANTKGYQNVAVGAEALASNTTGYNNGAVGARSLRSNTTGLNNQAFGPHALFSNVTGEANIAIGPFALYWNQAGTGNVAHGLRSQESSKGSYNTSVGNLSGLGIITGSNNTFIGAEADASDFDTRFSTAIGYRTRVTGSNQVRIGGVFVNSIGGNVSWSTLSDGRFKKDIKQDVSGLEFISKLRPVSYTIDESAVNKFLRIPDSLQNNSAGRKKLGRQTGFVAQEVEEIVKKSGYVFHGVESPQNENDHYSIRYAEFVVPLVKAVQELNTIVKQQQLESIEQKQEITSLKEQLKVYDGSTKTGLSETETVLFQNNPNPFSTDTEIKMELPENAVSAVVNVYNLEGKQLKDIKVQGRGKTSVKIVGSELNAGMYLYALIVDGKVVDTKRMILTK